MENTKEELIKMEDTNKNIDDAYKELNNNELLKASGGVPGFEPMHKPMENNGISTDTKQDGGYPEPKGKTVGKVSYSFDSYKELGVPYNIQYQIGSNHPVITWDLNRCSYKLIHCCDCNEFKKAGTRLGYCSLRSEENDLAQ